MCASIIWRKAISLWELGAVGVIPLAVLGANVGPAEFFGMIL
jgi:hypothetical protein